MQFTLEENWGRASSTKACPSESTGGVGLFLAFQAAFRNPQTLVGGDLGLSGIVRLALFNCSISSLTHLVYMSLVAVVLPVY